MTQIWGSLKLDALGCGPPAKITIRMNGGIMEAASLGG
jgi:hypothetical protein